MMAVYQYEFDSTRVGDLRLSRANYQLVQEGVRLLCKELETWNQRAMEHGAAQPPFEQEVADLTQLIKFGEEQLDQPYPHEVVVRGISLGNLRYVKSALMLVIQRREQDCAKKVQEGWPEVAVRSILDGVEKVKKLADTIDCRPSDILQEIVPKQSGISKTEIGGQMDWDVFISHASEDKETFVRPLATGLAARGLKVWFDEFTLTIGDSLRRSIDRGLAHSRFGVVVISRDFLRKEWPQKELDGLVAREVDGVKVILPVWHGIGANELRTYSPTLADRLAAMSDKGLDHVIDQLIQAIRQDDQSQRTDAREQSTDQRNATATIGKTGSIVDLWVNMEYPQKLGLIEKLKADGYDVYWERAINEATRIDAEGWEHVIVERSAGTRARLKIRDAPVVGGYVVLLKRKKSPKTR